MTQVQHLMNREAERVERRWQRAGRTVGAAFGAFVGMQLGQSLVRFARSTLDAVAALEPLSRSTGASVENLSALQDMAVRAGVGVDTVEAALTRFNKQLDAAARNATGPAGRVFASLSLDVAKLQKMDRGEALHQVAAAFARYADDGSKAGAMLTLFGERQRDVSELMRAAAEAGQLNASVLSSQAREAAEFKRQLAGFSVAINDLGRAIVLAVIPALTQFAQLMSVTRAEFGSFAQAYIFMSAAVARGEVFEKPAKALEFYRQRIDEVDQQIKTLNRTLAAQLSMGDKLAAGTQKQLDARGKERAELAKLHSLYQAYQRAIEPPKPAELPPALEVALPGGKTGATKALAENASSVEDFSQRISRSLGELFANAPSVKLAELNAQLEALDRLGAAGMDPNLIREVREMLLQSSGAGMGPPLSDEMKRVNELIAQTPTAQLKVLRGEMQGLANAIEGVGAGSDRWQELVEAMGMVRDRVAGLFDIDLPKQIDEAGKKMEDVFGRGVGDTISRMMRGEFDNIGDAWRSLLTEMAANAISAKLSSLLFPEGGLGGFFGGLLGVLGSARGNVFDGAGVVPFARGGVVTRPTMFGFGASNIGIMGEAGAEAILPLERGRGGKLGVVAHGGAGVAMHTTINIDSRTDRAQVAQLVVAAMQQTERRMWASMRARGVA